MITAVLIDDEISNVEHLGRLLAKLCPEVNVIGSTNAVSEARMLIEAKEGYTSDRIADVQGDAFCPAGGDHPVRVIEQLHTRLSRFGGELSNCAAYL